MQLRPYLSFSSRLTSLSRDCPILRLLDPYQAPWPLLYRLRQITQVFSRGTHVLECVSDVLIVSANHRLEIADQDACIREGLAEFVKIFLKRLAQSRDRFIGGQYGCIHVIHYRPYLGNHTVCIPREFGYLIADLVDP